MTSSQSTLERIDTIHGAGLLSDAEAEEARTLLLSCFSFADAVAAADSIHINVKVDDVTCVSPELTADAVRENEKEGYVKYAFPDGVNLILSSIDISQDDLIEAKNGSRRRRPFLDHLGIDLRQEAPEVREIFDAIPYLARKQGWAHQAQGGDGKAVFCCHVQVDAKHWVFPRQSRSVPLEFAYGKLTVNETTSGCDLRPANPLVYPEATAGGSACGA